MPEVAWLDDGDTLTYLHSTISTRQQRVRVPETPMHLDALLADEPLAGGLEPRLGAHHLRTLTVVGFGARFARRHPTLRSHRRGAANGSRSRRRGDGRYSRRQGDDRPPAPAWRAPFAGIPENRREGAPDGVVTRRWAHESFSLSAPLRKHRGAWLGLLSEKCGILRTFLAVVRNM